MNRIRIATVYSNKRLPLTDMAAIRWAKISEALADRGFQVDIILNTGNGIVPKGPNLRLVPYALTKWEEYDVIKTLFNTGFENLLRFGGGDHPFIISKLGSVVAHDDNTEGVYFFGKIREELFEIQKIIAEKSRYVTVLTAPSRDLWIETFGQKHNLLLVPGAAEQHIPEPCVNPYSCFPEPIALYAGHIYDGSQPEINLLWKQRLNRLGGLLRKKGIRLCLLGTGNTKGLDKKSVTYLGAVEYDGIWDYHYFANAAIVLGQGPVQHNESTKIYYYLRTGLPVVGESSIPNNYLIGDADLGFIANYGDDQQMTEMVEAAIHNKWDREHAMRYILENHTWNTRGSIYEDVIKTELGSEY
jgi:glycosyltransferase involved in cell wall biosynthesis